MEEHIHRGNEYSVTIVLVTVLTAAASILPEIVARTAWGREPFWLPLARVVFILGIVLVPGRRMGEVRRYGTVLSVVISMQAVTAALARTAWWRSYFDPATFEGGFGGNILLKVIGILPVLALLLSFYGTPEKAWLGLGDLTVRAEEIRWLGIGDRRFSWGRLSLISAFLISMGTILLTGLTVTGFSPRAGLERLLPSLPLVLLLALVNAFCEGVIYRSAMLATLSRILPKDAVVLAGALFFGIAHFYGIPSGPFGAAMSTLLGWYLLRGMYETGGFLSAWIIHSMQDAVIFATFILMRGA